MSTSERLTDESLVSAARHGVGTLPVILSMHGGGWVLGNADTHDRLVRELAVGTDAAMDTGSDVSVDHRDAPGDARPSRRTQKGPR